jgi:dynein heavy chain
MKNVATYIKDLCLRLQTYQNWVNNGPPKIFWISGFFFTQSFLTGVFQNFARKYKLEIDTLVYDFDFKSEDPTDYENEVYT